MAEPFRIVKQAIKQAPTNETWPSYHLEWCEENKTENTEQKNSSTVGSGQPLDLYSLIKFDIKYENFNIVHIFHCCIFIPYNVVIIPYELIFPTCYLTVSKFHTK